MTLVGLLVLLLIAAICGGIGQSLAGYSLGGCLVSIVVGFIGAWIGLWIAGRLGLPKLFEIIFIVQTAKTIFTPGIKNNNNHHPGLPPILSMI